MNGSSNNSKPKIPVTIRMIDGAMVTGEIIGGLIANMDGALNREAHFLEFISADGQHKFVAKHQIAYVEERTPLKMPKLTPVNAQNVNPYTILGLDRDAEFDVVKESYHRLAKLYHPDRMGVFDLPKEMHRYSTEMFMQINAAFTMIQAEIDARPKKKFNAA